MIRLMKPLSYYQEKYGSWQYGLNKLYLMMEKQHNRGQEGAGISCVKLECEPGKDYMFREKALGSGAITEVFQAVGKTVANDDEAWRGELLMGHLRYSTTGKSGLTFVHPFLRRNNWRAKNLCICGNFNMTNVDEVFKEITSKGQHPRIYSDTYIMLEQIGHRLDREVERLYQEATAKQEATVPNASALGPLSITNYIEDNVRVENVLRTSAPLWDGGYVVCGQTGSGEMFAMRDPNGIRPCFYYKDEEILVVASERPAIQTAMNIHAWDIQELTPGNALIVSKYGDFRVEEILPQGKNKACSFERIYFSRGSDKDIYQERKELGRELVSQILPAIDYDLEHTVFSYIPNTAEVAYFGLIEGMDNYLNKQKAQLIDDLAHEPDFEQIHRILSMRIRSEKVAIKDIKLRTFISEGDTRNDLAAHVYDITYGSLVPFADNLVIIDDSIVRGTTLKQSIIKILDRLHPKKIIIVSSAPQIRYPDYYGIDMSSMEQFVAFRATVALLKDRGQESLLTEVYEKVKAAIAEGEGKKAATVPDESSSGLNLVSAIYAPFTDEEVSAKIAELLTPDTVKTPVQIIFQTVEGLHQACPNSPGDWYFTGDYPTPGGLRMLYKSYISWYEQEHN